MASGTITKKFSVGYQLIVEWTSTSTISSNSSKVTCKVKLYCPYSLGISARTNNELYINGTRYYFNTGALSTNGGTTFNLATISSGDIAHNADGTKNIAITCYFDLEATISGKYYGRLTATDTVALDDIPRKATVTAAPNFNDEASPSITYNNAAGNAVEALEACISLDGSKDDVAYRAISKTGSSYTFNLTTAERNVLRNATKNANSRKVRFYVRTIIGGVTYLHYVEKTLTIVNAAPVLSPTATDTGSVSTVLTGDASGRIIKYYNSMQVNAGATAQKGASITSYKITCGSKSISSASGTLSGVDSGTITFSVTDSRGNTTTKKLTKTLVNYVQLTCNLAISAPSTSGDLAFTISGNYYNGGFGAATNSLTVEYRYKTNSGSYGAWTSAAATLNGNTYKANVSLTGLDYLNSYTFQARAADKIYNGSTEPVKQSAAKTVKTTPVFDWSAEDFAFNVPVRFNAGFSNANKVLWSGSYYMTEGQTANLNEAVSAQASGIVLIFSRYDISNSAALNEHFTYCYVPKQIIALHGGKGSVFNMATSNQSFYASKYLYIDDTAIRGHANNDLTGTGDSGITFANNRFVLRYVIGV